MKKKYINPVTEIVNVELLNIVCVSGDSYSLTSGAEWGGEGEYAPSEWIDEGHGGGNTGGYNTTVIEEDDEELFSRGKAWGGWDYNW